jgi:CheY-like chemotaxis protein
VTDTVQDLEFIGSTFCEQYRCQPEFYLDPPHSGKARPATGTGVRYLIVLYEEGYTPAYPGRFMVIDDEPTIRRLISEVLEEQGYSIIEASDGPSGMRVLSAARIDLLITDVGLPEGMNGRQIAEAGRELRPDTKVLFITGYSENAVVRSGHLEKGMRVFAKSFEMSALARKIREIIES